MLALLRIISVFDHCRIGSLEIAQAGAASALADHCRIGSLEKLEQG